MCSRRKLIHFIWLMNIVSLSFLLGVYAGGGDLSETQRLLNVLQAIDPNNASGLTFNGSQPDICYHQVKGVRCDLGTHRIVEINLEKSNLDGKIDADSLCKLKSLQVLILANNLIKGTIPDSISNCTSLVHLNLSSNLLHGIVPPSLTNLKKLRRLDVSKNNLSGPIPSFSQQLDIVLPHSTDPINRVDVSYISNTSTTDPPYMQHVHNASNATAKPSKTGSWYKYAVVFLSIGSFSLFVYKIQKKRLETTNMKTIQKDDKESPIRILMPNENEDKDIADSTPALVFFVEEQEKFQLEALFMSAAELQGQSLLSSLYKVTVENNMTLVVKRLKKLQVSVEEFSKTMTWVGNLKHPNILPLLAYHTSISEKLLIYKYQRNRSLLRLVQSYAENKRDFPWGLRLSIASGIARGLDYIHRKASPEEGPHGNLKLSNILLSDDNEPLISEYGFQRFIDPKRTLLYSSNVHIAPEKKLTEKADVYSFGVILLVLLTGKLVERNGVNLIKWVKAMVREEWTGEVFDKEVNRAGKQWAIPLLNIALKCVEQLPENRPTVLDVLVKIEDIANEQEDMSFTSTSSVESNNPDGCLLYSVIPEVSESPGY